MILNRIWPNDWTFRYRCQIDAMNLIENEKVSIVAVQGGTLLGEMWRKVNVRADMVGQWPPAGPARITILHAFNFLFIETATPSITKDIGMKWIGEKYPFFFHGIFNPYSDCLYWTGKITFPLLTYWQQYRLKVYDHQPIDFWIFPAKIGLAARTS